MVGSTNSGANKQFGPTNCHSNTPEIILELIIITLIAINLGEYFSREIFNYYYN